MTWLNDTSKPAPPQDESDINLGHWEIDIDDFGRGSILKDGQPLGFTLGFGVTGGFNELTVVTIHHPASRVTIRGNGRVEEVLNPVVLTQTDARCSRCQARHYAEGRFCWQCGLPQEQEGTSEEEIK